MTSATGNIRASFSEIGTSAKKASTDVDESATKIKTGLEDIDDKVKETGTKFDDTTQKMSGSMSRLSDDMRAQMLGIQGMITELQRQRGDVENEVDRALTDQKLALAKNQLRDLAKDAAWEQIKSDAKDLGIALRDIDGGSGGNNKPTVGGAGGFFDGIKSLASEGLPRLILMGTAATPVIVGLAGGVTALAGSLAEAAKGAGMLGGGAFAVGGVGLGSFLTESKLAESQISKQLSAYSTWNAAVRQYGSQSTVARTDAAAYRADSVGSGLTPQNIVSISNLGGDLRSDMRPGIQSVDQLIANAVGKLEGSAGSSLTGTANNATEAMSGALSSALDQLSSPQVLQTVNSLGQTFDQIANPLTQTGTNLLEAFLNMAKDAEPEVTKIANDLEHWSASVKSTSENQSRMNAEFQSGQTSLKDWGKLLEGTYSLLKTIFSQGAPTGNSMVVSLTGQLNKWDDWLKDNPTKVHSFFQTAEKDVDAMGKALSVVVSLVSKLGQELSPALQLFGSLTKDLGSSGIQELLELYLGGRALGLGGTGGFSTLGMLLNPHRGVANLAGKGVRSLLTKDAEKETESTIEKDVVEGAGGAGAGSLLKRLMGRFGGGAGVASETAEVAEGAETAAKAGGISSLLTSGGAAGFGMDVLSKYVAPLAAAQALFGFLNGQGNVGDRLQDSLHGLAPFIIPKSVSEAQRHMINVQDASNQANRELSAGDYNKVLNQLRISDRRSQEASGGLSTKGFEYDMRGDGTSYTQALNASPKYNEAQNRATTFSKVFDTAGQTALTNEIQQYGTGLKFTTEPVMFQQLSTWIKGLPPALQKSGLDSMNALAMSLEKHGDLPKGSVKKLNTAIEREFPGLVNYMRDQGLKADVEFAKSMNLGKSTETLRSSLSKIKQEFGLVNVDAKDSGDHLNRSVKTTLSDLQDITKTGTHAARVAAHSEIDSIRTEGATSFDTMTNTTDQQLTKLSSAIAAGTAGASNTAAQNMAALETNIYNAMNAGVITSAQGSQDITNLMNTALKAFGAKPIPLTALVNNMGGNNTPTPAPTKAFAEGGMVQIGRAGDRGPDTIRLDIGGMSAMVGSGEQVHVLNHSQQAFLNARTADVGGLTGMYRSINTPHHYASGGALPYGVIEGDWIKAGGPAGVARIAAAITGAESRFEPGAIQQGQPYATTGWGLWQITPGDSEPQFGVNQALLDPMNNARAAVAKYKASNNTFAPWTTYSSGRYLPFLQGAAPVMTGGGGGSGAWTNIKSPQVANNTGTVGTIVQDTLDSLTKAANAYGQRKAALNSNSTGSGFTVPIGSAPLAVRKAMGAAESQLGKPYVWGGYGLNAPGEDCSGFVSTVLTAAGLMDGHQTTSTLPQWGLPGDGKYITVGVRNPNTGDGHTMMEIDGQFFESGGGGPYGKASIHRDPGWDNPFPIHRHPPGLASGGMMGEFGELSPTALLMSNPTLANTSMFQQYMKNKHPQQYASGGFAGWFGNGGDFTVREPTLFGAGDGGIETVSVRRGGDSNNTTGSIQIGPIYVQYNAKGDIRKVVMEELEDLEQHLRSGDHDLSELMRF